MKTQIITLEAHDDLVSVRDRMSWAKSPRILLVWPGFVNVSLRAVDLRVLQQHAQYLGADLGLVTRQGDIRRQAQAFKIPVFSSAAEAQRASWPPRLSSISRRPGRSGNQLLQLRATRDALRPSGANVTANPIGRIFVFALGVLPVIALAALFVPRASIRLSPQTAEQSTSLPIEASASNAAVSLTGAVPALRSSVIVGGTKSVQTISQARIPEAKATGVVRLLNLTQSAVVIPAGTIVYSTSPAAARFATVSEVSLEAKLNSFVEVPIQALVAGAAGNIPANSIQAVEGSLGASVSAGNPEPTAGGTDRLAAVPSDGDRGRLRGALLDSLTQDAKVQLQSSIGPNDVLLPGTVRVANIEAETYDPPPGQPGSLLTLTLRLGFEAEYVKAQDLQHLAEANLNASLPAGFTAATGSLVMDVSGNSTSDEAGVSRFDLSVKRTIVRQVDPLRASGLVRGLSPAAAARALQADFPLAESPEIRLSPPWWPWLPLIPFRIAVSMP